MKFCIDCNDLPEDVSVEEYLFFVCGDGSGNWNNFVLFTLWIYNSTVKQIKSLTFSLNVTKKLPFSQKYVYFTGPALSGLERGYLTPHQGKKRVPLLQVERLHQSVLLNNYLPTPPPTVKGLGQSCLTVEWYYSLAKACDGSLSLQISQ